MKKLLLIAGLIGSITFPPVVQAKVCAFCKTDNFDTILSKNTKVVVDFYSPTCTPCMILKPIFENLGNEMGEDVLFITVNAQQFSSLASKYNVSSIPHLIIFKKGIVVNTSKGYRSKASLKSWVDSAFSKGSCPAEL